MTVASLNSTPGGPSRSVPKLGEAVRTTGADIQLFVNNKEGKTRQGNNTASTVLSVKAINKLGDAVKELKGEKTGDTLIHNHGIWLPFNNKPLPESPQKGNETIKKNSLGQISLLSN